MLLDSISHVAYRVAGLSAVVYAMEKTNILNSILKTSDGDVMTAVKTSALLSGSEFLSDHLLSIVTHVKVPSMYHTINQLGIAFVANALVIYIMERFDLDSMIIRGGSEEMRALQFAIFFVIVQEVSFRLIHMYMAKY